MSARHRKCKTPNKRRYPNSGAAYAAIRRMPVDVHITRAYRCKGHWHITSKIG